MTTVVVDASVLIDALLPGPRQQPALSALEGAEVLAGPQHLPIEVLSVLRKISLREDSPALLTARRTLAELDLDLVPLSEIGERVWELRHALSAYDAAYLAAAEHLGGTLLSADTALLEHPDRRCAVHNPRSAARP
ncbi:type II toxin-antitoxin system VapC family toxin [Saccharopolyspora sp. NPDC049357]|uniref:type II toxin-antitoxin system VapC family toxin n=1 Tax=Saccharopolyspora sp. NPDC049357 TaxID=3154507 RepID=UPI00342795BC